MYPFTGLFSGTTRVSQFQKGKTNLDFTEARDSEWQWHHLGHMQVRTSLQTDNHASTPPLSFFAGRNVCTLYVLQNISECRLLNNKFAVWYQLRKWHTICHTLHARMHALARSRVYQPFSFAIRYYYTTTI